MSLFRDRLDAGRKLAEKLAPYGGQKNTIVIGLPRGGVVTASAVAKNLVLPLDIIVPRKIGHPFNPEYALGAISEKGTPTSDFPLTNEIQKIIEEEKQEIARRIKLYRKGLPSRNLKDKTVILVDDGIATGHTMLAALMTAKEEGAKEVIIATPVLPLENVSEVTSWCDRLVYLAAPADFFAISQFYDHFTQNSDEEVISLLKPQILG